MTAVESAMDRFEASEAGIQEQGVERDTPEPEPTPEPEAQPDAQPEPEIDAMQAAADRWGQKRWGRRRSDGSGEGGYKIR
jgi:hypothetical protein